MHLQCLLCSYCLLHQALHQLAAQLCLLFKFSHFAFLLFQARCEALVNYEHLLTTGSELAKNLVHVLLHSSDQSLILVKLDLVGVFELLESI